MPATPTMRLPASSRRPSTTLWLTALLNEWNKKHRFSREDLDDADDPVLESDLDFDGGVTLESLKIFVMVFKSSVADYKEVPLAVKRTRIWPQTTQIRRKGKRGSPSSPFWNLRESA